ncbi:MAG TPA: phospho-N-acetylmuramoyl-pentapeptide-transferase [Polyangia bacterium]|jgi:phospho-N-acetylmuramoyl-pentapeptide-transferase|nr:phospho-N-acetylmuramoyl-pentapeptide-transferase [Polyangia bacterium]
MLFHLFHALRESVPGANVFRYVSTRIGMATLTSLLITFFVAPWFIRRARERQLGEVIREDGPATHAGKRGTPTMGGALIILALVAASVLWCDLRSTLVWLALFVTVGYGAIGFVDDYIKIVKKNKKGLPGRVKLLGQFLIGGVAAAWLYVGDALPPEVRLRVALPLVNFHHASLALPLIAYVAFAVFVLMSESNAVNLTDGLDGLAIGPVIICSFTLVLFAYGAGTTLRNFNIAEYLGMPHVPGAGELAVFCGAMGGAGIGFLWFNTHPAQVFMGDVGALALGGAIGFVGLATKTEFSLPVIGGVFVAEAVSDIIQVAYYKRTKKRVFLMAPIHHHFEKLGWPESRIVVRFWIVSFACAILGLIITLKIR